MCIASIRTCRHTDQVDIIDEIVSKALAHTCTVASQILSIEIFWTNIDTKFNIWVSICEHLNSGISWTVVCADVIDWVSIVTTGT